MSDRSEFYTSRTIASWDEVAPRHEKINSTLVCDVSNHKYNNLNPDFNDPWFQMPSATDGCIPRAA